MRDPLQYVAVVQRNGVRRGLIRSGLWGSVQADISVSSKGVVRGIHYADGPPSRAKYVTAVGGSFARSGSGSRRPGCLV